MLGDAFYRQFKDGYKLRCTDYDLNEDWLSYLDFRDIDSYRKDVVEFRPNYLFQYPFKLRSGHYGQKLTIR